MDLLEGRLPCPDAVAEPAPSTPLHIAHTWSALSRCEAGASARSPSAVGVNANRRIYLSENTNAC